MRGPLSCIWRIERMHCNASFSWSTMMYMSVHAIYAERLSYPLFWRNLPLRQLDPSTLCSLRDMLKLTEKYAFNRFRQNIITQIEEGWPCTLRQWDELESRNHVTILLSSGALDSHPDPESPDRGALFPEPASAIRLARECNIPTILPAAFYHLSRLSIDDDWGEVQGRREAVKTGCAVEWSLLTADDLRCLLNGQAKLKQAPQDILHFGVHSQEWPEVCSPEKRQKLLGEIEEMCIKSPDVLRITQNYIEKQHDVSGICHLCSSHIRRDLATFHEALWTLLSDLFSCW